MSRGFLQVCTESDCSELTRLGRCTIHAKEYDKSVRKESPWRWVYQDPRWRSLRRQVKREQPVCITEGCMELTHDVDHINSLESGGDPFARENVQGMCKKCHSRKTAREVRERKL